jgi:hypothetical protein
MGISEVLALFAAQFPIVFFILSALGSLVVLGQAVVAFTPSKKDDEAWEKLMSHKVLGAVLLGATNFAFIQKK